MIEVETGGTALVELGLKDANAGKFPQVNVLDSSGTPIAGSPFDLTHTADGMYQTTFTAPAKGSYSMYFEVYDDAPHSTLSDYELATEHLRIHSIWDEDLTSHVLDKSAGLAAIISDWPYVRYDLLTVDANSRPLTMRRRYFATSILLAASTAGGTGEGEFLTMDLDATHVSAAVWQSMTQEVS